MNPAEEPRAPRPASSQRRESLLQTHYLSSLCRTGREVYLYLVNGKRVRGKIEAFDTYAVLLFHRAGKKGGASSGPGAGRQVLVFKSSIMTVTPVTTADSIIWSSRVKRKTAESLDNDSVAD